MTQSAETKILSFGIVLQPILVLEVYEKSKTMVKGSILYLALSTTDSAEQKYE